MDLSLAAELVKTFEGFRDKPYLCPAGIPTIGYGSTHYKDGTAVTLSDGPITQDQAFDLMMHMLETQFLPGVLKICPNLAENTKALNAIVDFCYNLGIGKLRDSTLLLALDACDWDLARAQLKLWVHGGGKVLPGLVARREAEAALLPD